MFSFFRLMEKRVCRKRCLYFIFQVNMLYSLYFQTVCAVLLYPSLPLLPNPTTATCLNGNLQRAVRGSKCLRRWCKYFFLFFILPCLCFFSAPSYLTLCYCTIVLLSAVRALSVQIVKWKNNRYSLLYSFMDSEILLDDSTTKLTSLFALWMAGMRARWLCRIINLHFIRKVIYIENTELNFLSSGLANQKASLSSRAPTKTR